jgi:hypothetical protein
LYARAWKFPGRLNVFNVKAHKHTAFAAAVAMHRTRTLWDLSPAFGILVSLTTISIALHHGSIVFLCVAIKAIEPFVGAIPSIQPMHKKSVLDHDLCPIECRKSGLFRFHCHNGIC